MNDSAHNSSIDELLKNIIKKEIDTIEKVFDEAVKEIESHREGNHSEDSTKNLNDDIQIAKKYIEILKKSKLEQPENIFKVIAISGSLGRQFSNILNIVSTSTSTIKSLFRYLKKSIYSLSSYLWQQISQAMSLNEWSISGGINGGIFGLSGIANIQLTFDKKPQNQKMRNTKARTTN